jgi:hypothetical protein
MTAVAGDRLVAAALCHDHWGVIDFPGFTDFKRPADTPRERAASSSSDNVEQASSIVRLIRIYKADQCGPTLSTVSLCASDWFAIIDLRQIARPAEEAGPRL